MTVRTVTRRGERRLVVDILYTKPDGTKGRYRKDAEVQTREAARNEERRRTIELTTGVSMKPQPDGGLVPIAVTKVVLQSFKVTAANYLATYAVSVLKPSTRIGYTKILDGFLLPRIGDMPIDTIDANKVRELDAEMVETGAKAGTRRQMMIVIRSILCRYAVEAELLIDPPKLPKLPKQGKKIASTMTREEVDKIIEASSTSARHRLIILLAAHAGLRAGEIRGLRRCDVDLAARHLIVRKNLCRGETSTPKSGSERIVPLTPALQACLEGLPKGKPGDHAALTEKGTRWGEYGILQVFCRVLKRAGIAKMWREHDLRHYFVTSLFERGVGAHVVQMLAGHESLATTNLYAHVGRDDLRIAIASLK